jgi:hypothetical protein
MGDEQPGPEMTQKQKVIDSIAFDREAPTRVLLADLYSWVIWQFPRRQADGLCGAVRPPLPGQGWLPAVIRPTDNSALVYAHLDQEFDSPETAVQWLLEAPQA